jgi:hypothetical protein
MELHHSLSRWIPSLLHICNCVHGEEQGHALGQVQVQGYALTDRHPEEMALHDDVSPYRQLPHHILSLGCAAPHIHVRQNVRRLSD